MAKYLDLVGLPYSEGACGPESYDCLGVCLTYLRRCGVEVSLKDLSLSAIDRWLKRPYIDPRSARPSDVILSQNLDSSLHLDVVLDTRPLRTLTALLGHGACIRRPTDVQRVLGIYTFAG